MATTKNRWLLRLAPWFLPVGLVALWQLASSMGWLSTRILPAPSAVIAAGWALLESGEIWTHLAISGQRAAIGFAIGGGLGLLLGFITGLSNWGERFLDSSVQMIRNVPHLALIPLVILWFGIDEAAKIDGTTGWKLFRFITLPLISGSFTICFTLSLINGLKVFDQIAVMTDGGPGFTSETLVYLLYKVGFNEGRQGFGTAVGIMLLFIIIILNTLQQKFLRSREVQM